MEFIPICIRAKGHTIPKPLLAISIPLTPPASPNRTGTAKLRMSMAMSSSSAMIAKLPTTPRTSQTATCSGGQPGSPAHSLPQTTYSTNTHPWVNRVTLATARNFAMNRSTGGTGAAMIRFQLCPRCSSRHR